MEINVLFAFFNYTNDSTSYPIFETLA